jgi:hypothetical protein
MARKKSFRKIKFLIYFILILLIGGYIYFNLTYPVTIPATNMEIGSSQKQIERGKYLVKHVTVCLSCHSSRDWSRFSGPIIPGTEGMGGEKFEEGFPGTFYAGNITPAGIGEWTDGEVLRAITTGVTRDNRVLYPIMPYPEYHALTVDDLYSIIGYIRTLKPIVNEVPESSINFPMNLIVKTIPPESYIPIAHIDESNTLEYGKYIATIAVCKTCHTLIEGGKFNNDMNFAGGTEFMTGRGIVRSSNITPDIETGIGRWTREDFLNRFRHYADKNIKGNPDEYNTPMPWFSYSGMTERDLDAIYEYLKTVPPVHNKITGFTIAKTK